MHSDDVPVGRVLSRREALALLSAAGVTPFAFPTSTTAGAGVGRSPSANPGCIMRPEMIQGPYFLDRQLNRSDIRSEPSGGAPRPGAVLTLTFQVSRIHAAACAPLQGATVDVWQCDARGEYSGFEDVSAGFDTRGRGFLRGYQVTDANGIARFTTIYPGWYAGRAVHIHFKIREAGAPGEAYEFASQLFFDEALTDRVHARSPYTAKGPRDTRNEADRFFRSGGKELLLSLAGRGDAFDATFGIGLDRSDAEAGRPDR